MAVSDLAEHNGGEPFQSLYRRFRPQRFDEVRGQSHVTLALRNAVRENRVAHAYLFSGPRGTGKTSTARILGKALNCTALIEGEPCGVCDSCRSIAAGSSFDVHELDAASNNGVEAMRDLVARASLATPGRWKVYIVDEVHMLSTAASNALLKTLEEPPDHVVFVLATTDPQKVLATIRSRTQQYEFHLMADDVLATLVEDVAASAGLSLPEGAASRAVRRGRGSARDTLSILDQVAASGVVDDDTDDLSHVVGAIAQEDASGALTSLDHAVRHGRDPQQIAVDLVELLRIGFLSLAGVSSVAEGVARLSPEELEIVRSLGLPRCVRAMELVGNAIVAMRDAPEPRITLEMAVLRAAALDADTTVDALLERVARLERRVEALTSGVAPAAAPPAPPPLPTLAPAAAVPPAESSPPPPERPASPTEPRTAAARAGAPTPEPTEPPVGGSETSSGVRAANGGEPIAPTRRPALGAFRTRAEETSPTPPPQREQVAPTEPVRQPDVAVSQDRPQPAASDATRAAAPATPDRDAFVLAWGDAVLTGLRPRTRMLYNVGRFISADGGVGAFALPNAFHVQMAEPHRVEVEAALSSHLGVPVSIELVVDDKTSRSDVADAPSPPATGRGGTREADLSDDVHNLDDVGEPVEDQAQAMAAGAEWATDRIRAAFPGTEELPT